MVQALTVAVPGECLDWISSEISSDLDSVIL